MICPILNDVKLWPETEGMWTCWILLLGKTREITSSKLIVGGLWLFGITVGWCVGHNTNARAARFPGNLKKKAGFGRPRAALPPGGSNWVSRTTSMSHIVSKHDCQHFGYMSRIYTLVVLDTFQRIRNLCAASRSAWATKKRRHEARPMLGNGHHAWPRKLHI